MPDNSVVSPEILGMLQRCGTHIYVRGTALVNVVPSQNTNNACGSQQPQSSNASNESKAPHRSTNEIYYNHGFQQQNFHGVYVDFLTQLQQQRRSQWYKKNTIFLIQCTLSLFLCREISLQYSILFNVGLYGNTLIPIEEKLKGLYD